MVDLYVMDHDEFSLKDLDTFVKQYRDVKRPLEKLKLCESIAQKCWRFAKEQRQPTRGGVTLPYNLRERIFPRGNPPDDAGVYAIFCRPTQWPCFYVGMATDSVRVRLLEHLRHDIQVNWAGTFERLSECSRLWVCPAVVSDWQEGEANTGKLKLLEMCLTVRLRAWWHDC
jgi:hypothetical protein